MSHMVIYRTVDGKPGFHQTDDLVAAVEFVERLRNVEGVENARIYRLEQVNFRFQPYYQVHIDAAADGPTVPSQVVNPPEPAPVEPVAPSGPVAPAALAEPAPVPPPVLSAAMAAAAAEPAPSFEPAEAGVPSLGVTPSADPNDTSGIRRGLFGR